MRCSLCGGLGEFFYSPMGKYVICHSCNGTGSVSQRTVTCPVCKGRGNTGKIPSGFGNTRPERCRYCYGKGTYIETD